jgi:hypothetical protein
MIDLLTALDQDIILNLNYASGCSLGQALIIQLHFSLRRNLPLLSWSSSVCNSPAESSSQSFQVKYNKSLHQSASFSGSKKKRPRSILSLILELPYHNMTSQTVDDVFLGLGVQRGVKARPGISVFRGYTKCQGSFPW